jgi:hypothetical protein
MIRHIVMFKLKEFGDESERNDACLEVIKHLDALPEKIDLIRRYKAGIDIRRLTCSFDVVLEMDFDSMADLDAYTVHPAHQDFIEFNKDYSAEKACIDFVI